MTDRERIRKAFAALHASPDAVREAMIMTDNKNRSRRHHRAVSVPLAAVLILALGITAFAALDHADFFRNAFGSGVESARADEEFPAMERISVDEAAADELIGQYVSSLNDSFAIGGWTWTVGDYILDQNGIGAVAVRLENPSGVEVLKEAYDNHTEPPVGGGLFSTSSGKMIDSESYVVSGSWTDTSVDMIFYLVPFSREDMTGDIAFSNMVYLIDDNGEVTDADEGSIIIPASERVSASDYAGEDISVSVSPVGMRISYSPDKKVREIVESDIVITLDDGTSYTVKSDAANVINESVSSKDEGGNVWIAFNRLIDPANITGIAIEGNKYYDDNIDEHYSCELH